MSRLNTQQQAAVHYIDSPLLVLAGAGSGKTSVITRKIAWLIEKCDYQPRHIAAVTFTNKAAREMRARVGQMLQGRSTRGLVISTFHHLGLTIIRQEAVHLGLKSRFSIFDQQDSQTLIKDILIKDVDPADDQIRQLMTTISNWKNDLVLPEQAITLAEDAEQGLAARVYESYQRSLRAYNAVDFDDLILLPVTLFEREPEVLEKWQRRIRYLLVDEYQDTNSSQYRLIRQITGVRGTLTVVGDDDQSIYSWRGARPENMQQLQTDFPDLRVIKLEQNYRSNNTILQSANALIANNPHLFEKSLWSELGHGDPLRIVVTANEDAEAERIATEILGQIVQKRLKFGDFAVLYRGNHQARLLEIKLQAHQIPYQVTGGTSFFARTEIRDLMAYLKLLINPDDDNAFLRSINLPRRGIGPAILEGLGAYADRAGCSLFEACGHLGLSEALSESQVERLQEFHAWMSIVAEKMAKEGGIRILREFLDDLGYQAWLEQNAKSPASAERAIANLEVLLTSIEKSMQRDRDDGGEGELETAINRLLLRDMLEQQEEQEVSNRVQLMTLHAAKGLEFPHVYIMGMEEELLPHRNSIESDDIEEERRLAYVGITRAKRQLTFMLAAKRKQYGEMSNTQPSRFLEELPKELVSWEGRRQDHDPEKEQVKGNNTLAGLRDLLG